MFHMLLSRLFYYTCSSISCIFYLWLCMPEINILYIKYRILYDIFPDLTKIKKVPEYHKQSRKYKVKKVLKRQSFKLTISNCLPIR